MKLIVERNLAGQWTAVFEKSEKDRPLTRRDLKSLERTLKLTARKEFTKQTMEYRKTSMASKAKGLADAK